MKRRSLPTRSRKPPGKFRSELRGLRAESSLCLILAYAFYLLCSPFGGDALPKGARLRFESSLPGAGAQPQGGLGSIARGGLWSDDEQDACHSSPADRKQDEIAAFAWIDTERQVRKGLSPAPPLPRFPTSAIAPFPIIPMGGSLSALFQGPALPFADRLPAFLISDLPPPLPA